LIRLSGSIVSVRDGHLRISNPKQPFHFGNLFWIRLY